ncbi:putative copper homeostasis (lipo)protein LpqS [Mycobacterium sp. ML4]
MTAVGVWVLVLGHAEVRHEPAVSHPAHALVSSLGGEFTVNSNHAHIENPSVAHHESFMTAVLPNAPVTTVAALSVLVASVSAVELLRRHVISGGRGPPRGLAAALTGQELLTRLCSSRR